MSGEIPLKDYTKTPLPEARFGRSLRPTGSSRTAYHCFGCVSGPEVAREFAIPETGYYSGRAVGDKCNRLNAWLVGSGVWEQRLAPSHSRRSESGPRSEPEWNIRTARKAH